MNIETIMRVATAILFVVVLTVRKIYEGQSVEEVKAGVAEDRDDARLIGVQSLLLTVSLLSILVTMIIPRWLAWSFVMLPDWLRWLGVALGASGAALLAWSHRALGENFFGGMKLRRGHQLVQDGPYRWMRHPIYSAFLALGFAWFFLTQSWFAAGAWLLSIAIALATRLRAEEEMLAEAFGKEFEAYRARTGRFLPRLLG
jgi:protein-S-isoprenylcysteine O-methyltransferase Ste14